MNTKFLVGALAASSVLPMVLMAPAPVHAFAWDTENRNWVTFEQGDAEGTYVDVFYRNATVFDRGGNYDVEGLSAEVRFTLLGAFESAAKVFQFEVEAKNLTDESTWDSSELSLVSFRTNHHLFRHIEKVDALSPDTFKINLHFWQPVDTFTLSDFSAKWTNLHSKDGNTKHYAISDAHGVGYGEVPTPALIPALIGSGIAALRRRKQESGVEVESAQS